MATFVMATRLSPSALEGPGSMERLEEEVVQKIEREVAGIRWIADYSTLGPYDYIDVFEAPGIEEAMKVSAIIRTYGHAHTEVWAALEWQRFEKLLRDLPE